MMHDASIKGFPSFSASAFSFSLSHPKSSQLYAKNLKAPGFYLYFPHFFGLFSLHKKAVEILMHNRGQLNFHIAKV